jgi:hypothetical protein
VVVPVSRVLRFLSVLPALVFLSACTAGLAGASVAGDYTCTDSIFDSLKLSSGGKAHVTATAFGETHQVDGTYDVQGNKISLTIDVPTMPQPAVFTKSGNTLNGGMLGTCTRH